MTYDVPELRLVGATREIVLGSRTNKVFEDVPRKDDQIEGSYDNEPEGEW